MRWISSLPNVRPNLHPGCIYLTSSLQDIILAKDLFAFSPLAQKTTSIASQHGVDLILGGHDHIYFASQGVTSWEIFDVNEKVLGAESDNGDILVIKSGSDFRDLSEINLKLASTPNGSVRKKVISEISGQPRFYRIVAGHPHRFSRQETYNRTEI